MRIRIIPCPRRGAAPYQPGDAWYARDAVREDHRGVDTMHQVTRRRWARWADHGRLMDDSEVAAEHADRRPLIVVLPNGVPFPTTSPARAGSTVRAWHRAMAAWAAEAPGRTFEAAWDAVPRPAFEAGWRITGDGDSITLSPSIDYDPGGPNGWHGWLENGLLRQ